MSTMSSGETRRRKSQNEKTKDGKYIQAARDEEVAMNSSKNCYQDEVDTILPYPEAQLYESPRRLEENEALTTNGNSLPDISHRPKTKMKEKVAKCCSYPRCLYFLWTFICVLVVFIAGIKYEERVEKSLINRRHDTHDEYKGPIVPFSPKPEEYSQRQIDLVIKLKAISGDIISVPNTLHHKAAHWMLWIDKSGITADSPFVRQRYILALFYYHMGDKNGTFELNENTGECSWGRIGCDDKGHVQHIRFVNCDLSGSIPMEILALKKLNYLDLSRNNLTGEIPEKFHYLTKMQYLFMDNNNLEGVMPASLCDMRKEGTLLQLTSDCDRDDKKVHCTCCSNCVNILSGLGPADNPSTHSDGETSSSNNHLDIALSSRQKGLMQKLRNISGDVAIDDSKSPQHKAHHWMIKVDSMELAANAANLYQRYVLVILWNMMETVDKKKCFSINPGLHECDWYPQARGVEKGSRRPRLSCDSEMRIQTLHLNGCKLKGKIPDELRFLSDLTSINFNYNSLEGPIPSRLKKLHNLKFLYLDNNNLKGAVPEEICNMKFQDSLVELRTDCTEAKKDVTCSCCINCAENITDINKPDDLSDRQKGLMQKLRKISGDVAIDDSKSPQHKAHHWMIKVDSMELAANAANLYQRYIMVLFFYTMDDQEQFDIDAKSDECTWSDRISCVNERGLRIVTSLKFDNCTIQGPIPTEIKFLWNLSLLDLRSNDLSGKIPSELADLDNLSTLLLNANNLEGAIPNSLCDIPPPFTVTADCNKVDCPCCKNCMSKELPSPTSSPKASSAAPSSPDSQNKI